jgi:hypothetical protein
MRYSGPRHSGPRHSGIRHSGICHSGIRHSGKCVSIYPESMYLNALLEAVARYDGEKLVLQLTKALEY